MTRMHLGIVSLLLKLKSKYLIFEFTNVDFGTVVILLNII